MRIFFAYIRNNTDSLDDDVIKFKARDKGYAMDYAKDYCAAHGNVTLGRVMTRKELKKLYPEWHQLLWGLKCV